MKNIIESIINAGSTAQSGRPFGSTDCIGRSERSIIPRRSERLILKQINTLTGRSFRAAMRSFRSGLSFLKFTKPNKIPFIKVEVDKVEVEVEEEVVAGGQNVLEIKNRHKRDKNIKLIEYCHRYIVNEKIYESVTAFINSHFSKFDADSVIKNMGRGGGNFNKSSKYRGMTPYEIKKAWRENGAEQARLGTRLHSDIECFMNNDIRDDDIQIDYSHQDLLSIYEFESENTRDEVDPTGRSIQSIDPKDRPLLAVDQNGRPIQSVEWSYFLNFVRDHAEYKPYRTEMKIYSEQLKIAGSIDMLYKNSDGSFSIFDWKRSKEIQKYNMYKKFSKTESVKHLPDLNFVHYSLQLNLYKYILETNYNFKIKDLILVQLHPNFKNYKLYECLDLTSELDLLIKERKNMLLATT